MVPAAAVIAAPTVYFRVGAVKNLVVGLTLRPCSGALSFGSFVL